MAPEAEIGMTQLQGRGHREPPEAVKKQVKILAQSLRREHSPVNTLISDFSFQNCDRIIHFCCSKSPSL